MSAAEVIEMIKRLPPQERAEVAAFLQGANSDAAGARLVPDAEFERAAQRVLADNHDLLRRLAQ